ncbi:MAG TPA: DEAD/DEAH box helicase [Prolixibacteraceae bacterium]|nr:DEAD/DEAH box helicase [Prolixibacteraceae bacterium]
MKQLQAGYFVDEIRSLLKRKGANMELFSRIVTEFSYFTVDGCDNVSIQNPLLAVAHKIVCRGIPTRASIEVSEALLIKHFKDFFKGTIKKEKSEVVLDLKVAPNIELIFFKKKIAEKQFNKELLYKEGASLLDFSVFNCIEDLSLIAKLEIAIIFLLAQKDDYDEKFSISFDGEELPQGIIILAISDLNTLFKHLKVLSGHKDQLPILLFDPESENEILISNDKNYYSNRGITLFVETDQSFDGYDNCFFTTQRIHYPNFEDTTEYRGAQDFKIVNEEKENALLYFLNNIFRKTDFYAGQKAIINRALQGYDVIGLLPTGGGKSLTYQFCSLLQPGFTIVVDPINSLMKDQHDKLVLNGINCSGFYNSLLDDKNKKQEILDQFEKGKFLIFLISPERLQIDFFRNTVKRLISNDFHFSYAVIDEAHCVSEWGHDFRFPYLNLGENIRRFFTNGQQPAFFGLTATASFDVLSDVQRELGLESEEAIITLPPEAIDREELEFRIIDVGETCPEIDELTAEYYIREKHMGEYKYPLIEKYISETALKSIQQREKGKDSIRNFFYKSENGYENAGIIFCPTKSDKLSNGVLAVRDGYERGKKFISGLKDSNKLKDKLEIGTFFGAGDSDGVVNAIVNNTAKESLENQVKFLNNELNLMISTKAFGMGIDKPNIRYTLHYAFPSSVESFYQEAGRAGRNRQPALCSVLYHPSDERMNLDFVENGFKGTERERKTLFELLTEVKYEDQFILKYLNQLLRQEFPDHPIDLYLAGTNLFIYGNFFPNPSDKEIYGKIALMKNFPIIPGVSQNVDELIAEKITKCCSELLLDKCNSDNPVEWLKTITQSGINSLLEKAGDKTAKLIIGFNNDVANDLVDFIKKKGIPDFDIQIINSAFNFSNTEVKFLENLKYHYKAKTGKIFDPNQSITDKIKNDFKKIRKGENTQRAVYRLITLGIIDDYTINYSGRAIEVTFKNKSEEEYKKNFRKYLRKYLGEERTEEWLAKVEKCEANTLLERYLWVLIEFVYDQIYNKRISAVGYMKDLCEKSKVKINEDVSGEKGKALKSDIVYYFTSKYANALNDDLSDLKVDSEIVTTYVNEIYYDWKDGKKIPGTELNNAKHLRGACDRLLIDKTDKRPALFILHAFSLFALEYGGAKTENEILAKPMIQKAIEEYRTGFMQLVEKEDWQTCLKLISIISKHVKGLNPPLVKPLNRLEKVFLMHYNLNKLKEINTKFSSEIIEK